MTESLAKRLYRGEVIEHACHGLAESDSFAAEIASLLAPGGVLALRGPLGAGKTTLIRMIARHLGFQGIVSSPTFTLLNIYEASICTLYHFDFYRLNSEWEALGIGAEEFLGGEGICFVEWPERIPSLLPETYLELEIRIPDFSGNAETRSAGSQTFRAMVLRKINSALASLHKVG